MKNSLKQDILDKIKKDNLKAFVVSDFLDLGSYDAIRQTLSRLEKNNDIRRVIRGVYDKPLFHKAFNMFESPDIGSIVLALSRSFNWNICPSGNVALNLLGLSNQVPSKYIYVSDGPYKEYNIEGTIVQFKHSNKKEISNYSYITMLVIQAIKIIGVSNITKSHIDILNIRLSTKDKEIVLKEGKQTNIWIYEIIKRICEEKCV